MISFICHQDILVPMRAKIIVIAAVLVCAVGAAGWYIRVWEYSPPYLEVDFLSL